MNTKNVILSIVAIILLGVIGVEVYVYNKTVIYPKNSTADTVGASQNKEIPNKDKTWHGVTSKDEVKKAIDGTTWESVERNPTTGLWMKFVINGNSVDEYTARNTLNYNDPKTWNLTVKWKIYGVYEPQQGLYCVALKGKEGEGIFEDVPVFISFLDEKVFYSMADDHVFLKLVK